MRLRRHRHDWVENGCWGADDSADEPRVAWRQCAGCRTAIFTRVPRQDHSLPYQHLRMGWTVRIERSA